MILSSGGYQDLWKPLFFYLEKYLEDGFFDKIYLTTDYSDSQIPENIEILKFNQAWSDRLLNSLDKIGSDNIFIILEDYILKSPTELKTSYEIFKNLNLDYLRVSYKKKLPEKECFKISKFKPYNISLQPGFWNKKFLKKIIRSSETPWEFELLGSLRNIFLPSKCFALGEKFFVENKLPYPCIFTGSVVKGKLIKTEFIRFNSEIKNLTFSREIIENDAIIDNVRLNKTQVFLGLIKNTQNG